MKRLAFIFIVLAAVVCFCAFNANSAFPAVLFASCSGSLLLVGVAYLINAPRLLMKRADGTWPFFAYILIWPYIVANQFSLALFRLASRKPPFDEIVPGLRLGCRLWNSDRQTMENSQTSSVLDLTAEFSEVGFLRKLSYRCIPMLDTSCPTLNQLAAGIAYIEDSLQKGPIYVHCALGHSRSATFVAGYLISAKIADGVEQAVGLIQSKRSGVRLNHAQTEVLEQFSSQICFKMSHIDNNQDKRIP
jgi:hypothetical protein